MLIDVGPKDADVVNKLRHYGVVRVDLVLLSHPDADHIGGLQSVCAAYPGLTVEAPGVFEHDDKMTRPIAEAAPANMRWTEGENDQFGTMMVSIRCHAWQEPEDDNEGSMVVKIVDKDATFVTSGDGPADEEQDMIADGDNWQAQVLHFGHHGSRTASSQAWLSDVHPVYGVVSCGLNNRYGHPHKETVDRAAADGIQVLRTDTLGDLEFDVAKSGFVWKR
jgi:beta-lactamase superfamily II metal-dependent hydrolase